MTYKGHWQRSTQMCNSLFAKKLRLVEYSREALYFAFELCIALAFQKLVFVFFAVVVVLECRRFYFPNPSFGGNFLLSTGPEFRHNARTVTAIIAVAAAIYHRREFGRRTDRFLTIAKGRFTFSARSEERGEFPLKITMVSQ